MTKKDFQALADIVKEYGNLNVPCTPAPAQIAGQMWLANKLADMCSDKNPRFNRTLFLKACGVDND